MSNLDAKTAAVHYAMKGIAKRYPSGRKIICAPCETEAQIKSVVLAQRAKLGLTDKLNDQKHAFAFGRFDLKHKLQEEYFSAGVAYADTSRRAKLAAGFITHDYDPGNDAVELTLSEIAEHKRVMQAKWYSARACLISVSFSCACACDALIIDGKDAGIYKTDLIKNGLLKLAEHYGFLRH